MGGYHHCHEFAQAEVGAVGVFMRWNTGVKGIPSQHIQHKGQNWNCCMSISILERLFDSMSGQISLGSHIPSSHDFIFFPKLTSKSDVMCRCPWHGAKPSKSRGGLLVHFHPTVPLVTSWFRCSLFYLLPVIVLQNNVGRNQKLKSTVLEKTFHRNQWPGFQVKDAAAEVRLPMPYPAKPAQKWKSP